MTTYENAPPPEGWTWPLAPVAPTGEPIASALVDTLGWN